MAKRKYDKLDALTNEIEQAFMRQEGWKTCRYLLGKLMRDKQAQLDKLIQIVKGYQLTGDGEPLYPEMRVWVWFDGQLAEYVIANVGHGLIWVTLPDDGEQYEVEPHQVYADQRYAESVGMSFAKEDSRKRSLDTSE